MRVGAAAYGESDDTWAENGFVRAGGLGLYKSAGLEGLLLQGKTEEKNILFSLYSKSHLDRLMEKSRLRGVSYESFRR